jgi:AraC-like DNA-binding protein
MLAGGPHAGPVEVHHSGGHHGVQLSLTPAGCRAVLGVPAGALADELVELDRLLGLPQAAIADGSWEQRFAMIDAALLGAVARRQDGHGVTPELAQVWSEIARSGGNVRIADCASAVGWSRRRLLDRFRAEFGLGPKQTARIVRFQASRRMLERGDPLARIASECGYSDQAHLTREWRALTSYSPRRWVAAERRPSTTAAD